MKDRHVWTLVCAALVFILGILAHAISSDDEELRPTQIHRTVELCSSIRPVEEVQVWWSSKPDLRQVIDSARAARLDGAFWCVLTDVGTPLFPGDGNLFVSGLQGEVTGWRVDETGSVVARPVVFESDDDNLSVGEYVLSEEKVSQLLGKTTE